MLQSSKPQQPATEEERLRRKGRVWNALLIAATALASMALLAMISGEYTEYRWLHHQTTSKETKLAALQAEAKAGHADLDALQTDEGKERLLMEHGYVKPGDRVLLFPPAPAPTTPEVVVPMTDEADSGSDAMPEPGATVWARAGTVMRGWVHTLRTHGEPAAPAARPTKPKDGEAAPEASTPAVPKADHSAEPPGTESNNGEPVQALPKAPNAAAGAPAPRIHGSLSVESDSAPSTQ